MKQNFLISLFASLLLVFSGVQSLHAGVVDLHFAIGKTSVDASRTDNSLSLAALKAFSEHSANSLVTITAYSSPDGRTSRNDFLSSSRAESVKVLLEEMFPSYTFNIYSAGEDWKGVETYLSTLKAEWKEEALAIVRSSDKSKRKQLLQELWVGEAWDHLMKYCFPALRRVSVSFSDSQEQKSDAGQSLVVGFKPSSTAPLLTSGLLATLKDLVNSAPESIRLTAFASPEGSEPINEKLSIKRAERLRDRLLALGYTGKVEIVYGGMDWDGLKREVSASAFVPSREAVLQVLDASYPDAVSRKKALQGVAYGRSWLHLMENEMQPLRRVEISVL